jgi:hypothetical protein
MTDFPLSTFINEDGNFVIRQPLTLGDPQDYVEIEMSAEQSDRLLKELQALKKKEAPEKESGTFFHFEEFWLAYPAKRRVDKSGCKRKWVQRNLDSNAMLIISHVRQLANTEWMKDGGKYVPLITTYMSQSRWESAEEAMSFNFTGPSV